MRTFALSLGAVFGAAALGVGALSVYWGNDLADWQLPGLAALAAIACNVMLMLADRARRGTRSGRPGLSRRRLHLVSSDHRRP